VKIKTVIESDEGAYEFQAELTPQQHAFLLEYAIRDLIRKGLLPFLNVESEDDFAKIVPNPTEGNFQ
jgi:hypothetical protein